MIRWGKNKIIKELVGLSIVLGHSPSAAEAGPALFQACRRYFGSINRAKIQAGLKISPLKHHVINPGAKTITRDLGYVYGVLKGDGYYRIVVKPQRTSAEALLKVKHYGFAKEFESRIKKWAGVSPKFYKKHDEFYVVLYSIDAVKIIESISFEKIRKASKKIKAEFLKGLYDSDGGVTGTNLDNRSNTCRWIHFSNRDKEIIRVVGDILKEFKIDHKIRSRVHSGFNSKKLQYELLIFGLQNFEKFYKNIGFAINDKNKKLLEVIRSYEKYRKKQK